MNKKQLFESRDCFLITPNRHPNCFLLLKDCFLLRQDCFLLPQNCFLFQADCFLLTLDF